MKVWILSSVLRYWGPEKHTKQFSLQMRNLKLFITAVCVISLTKLPWPKSKSLYAEQLQKNYLYLGGKHELDSMYLTIVPQWAAAKNKQTNKKKKVCKPYTFIYQFWNFRSYSRNERTTCYSIWCESWKCNNLSYVLECCKSTTNVKSYICWENPPVIDATLSDLAPWILLKEHGKYFVL